MHAARQGVFANSRLRSIYEHCSLAFPDFDKTLAQVDLIIQHWEVANEPSSAILNRCDRFLFYFSREVGPLISTCWLCHRCVVGWAFVRRDATGTSNQIIAPISLGSSA